MRRALFLSAALLLSAVAAGAATRATRVTVYRPFVHGKLAAGLKVVRTAKGQCFSGSVADPRSDAWRCQFENTIADPCFSDKKIPSWVACPEDGSPFGTRVVRLALSKSLPKSLGNGGGAGQGNPWAVKLAGGEICTFLTGATFAFHGRRVNYGCAKTTFLAGSPERSGPTWTIILGTGRRSKPRTATILVAAW